MLIFHELVECTVRIVLPAEEKLSEPLSVELLLGPQTEPPTSYSLEPTGASSRYLLPFRDAISLIKSLFIRYVWIDTLCVIQSGPGSSEDWHSECSKMQDIYSNCTVSLCLSSRASQRLVDRLPTRRCHSKSKRQGSLACRIDLYHYPLGLPSRTSRSGSEHGLCKSGFFPHAS